MTDAAKLFLGNGDHPVYLLGRYANRHGLIAGATGTGKTVSLQVLAEAFSRLGVPVFAADMKGDLSGVALPASVTPRLQERIDRLGIVDYTPKGNPVVFWDLYGDQGHPIRATISELGPTLLARMMELNDTQEGVLNVLFRVADDAGLLLLDLPDLRAMLTHVADDAKDISARYGLVNRSSIGAIQRALLRLENDGGDRFFGEPALQLDDLMRQDFSGQGIINLLAADKLLMRPRLYSSFLLWLMSELFERLPEVGDQALPKLVFFFDEAHLLFDDAPPALLQRIEQVVRLIRSKGVGIYFCSQSPGDIPDAVLGQLGNRVQHALRAYTPRDQKAVRVAAETFVPNPKFEVAEVISSLGVGEALVSTLQDKGIPSPVEKTYMAPPFSRIGPLDDAEREQIRKRSPVGGKYDTAIDRESAYEILKEQAEQAARAAEAAKNEPPAQPPLPKATPTNRPASRRQSAGEAMVKSAARSIGSQLGRSLMRGILGSLFRGK